MKPKTCALLILAGFASLSRLVGGPESLPHRHLGYASAKTTYELVDEKDETVRVEIVAVPNERDRFDVTITCPTAVPADAARVYSLLTLGIQSYDLRTVVLDAPAGTKFGQLNDTVAKPKTFPLEIKPTNPNKGDVEDKKVWFVSFSTTSITLKIQREANHRKTTVWKKDAGFATGHGVEPP